VEGDRGVEDGDQEPKGMKKSSLGNLTLRAGSLSFLDSKEIVPDQESGRIFFFILFEKSVTFKDRL